jgi:hypothetical protein
MSYEEISDLARDQDFAARLAAAVTEQAKTHDDYISGATLRSPEQGVTMFMPFVSTEPGFAAAYGSGGQEAISDGMILSGVQANWDRVNTTWEPITTPVVVP